MGAWRRLAIGARLGESNAWCAVEWRLSSAGRRRHNGSRTRSPTGLPAASAGDFHRHDRNGKAVPPSHRLDGGSSADTLQWEAGNSACLAKIYRLVHGSAAPISIVTAITYPDSLPVGDEESQHLIDYFSDPRVFGDDFPTMRHALRRSVGSFTRERGAGLSGLEGQWGKALEFLQYAMPGQSILVGSSSIPARPALPICLGRWGPLPLRPGATFATRARSRPMLRGQPPRGSARTLPTSGHTL